MVAARLQRWLLQLAAHNYTVQLQPTKTHANADALSHFPLKGTESKECFVNTDLFSIGQIEALSVTSLQLKSVTNHDQFIS